MIYVKELLRKRGGFVQFVGHSMPANAVKELYLPSLNCCTAFAIAMTWSRVREGLPRRESRMERRQGGDGVGIDDQCAAVGLDVVLAAGIVGDAAVIGVEELILGQTRVSRVVSNFSRRKG